MRVIITITDHEIACLIAEAAENEGLTAHEWVNEAFDAIRFRLRESVQDMKVTGGNVRLVPRLTFG